MAHSTVAVMGFLNPQVKEMNDYKQKLWDHLFMMAGFDLDVDAPFPVPSAAEVAKKPERIEYPTNHIKFRFYGRNLQFMVKKASDMEEGEAKSQLVNLVASYMRNSCKNWNNENLTPEMIAEHLQVLSQGKLNIAPESLTITYEKDRMFFPRNKNNDANSNNRRNFSRGKNNSNNNKKNFRKKITGMGSFQITGGRKLKGELIPQGAKNEALQIISAVLLTS